MIKKLTWQVCFILFLSTTLFVQCAKREQLLPSYTGNYGNLTVREVKNILDTKSKIILLDVRTPAEYAEGHIKGSILIPVQELENRFKELSAKKKIIVYCKAGVRSVTASGIFVNNGYKHIYNMLGGIDAWKSAGFPIEK